MKRKRFKTILTLCMVFTMLFGNMLTVSAVEQADDYYYGDATLDEEGYCNYVIETYTGCYSSKGIYESITLRSKEPLLFIVSNGENDYGKYRQYLFRTRYKESAGSTITANNTTDYEIISYKRGTGTDISEIELSDYSGSSISSFQVYYELDNAFLTTNIPLFDDEESAISYMTTGDDSVVINKKPVPENDETFQFVDFDINEYVSATWFGTTFDEQSSNFDSMYYEVVTGYALEGTTLVSSFEKIVTNGNLSSGSWSKKQTYLAPEDDTMYLRVITFTPVYEVGGSTCRGKVESLLFDELGNIDYVANEELTVIEDSDFHLNGVSIEYSTLGLVDGHIRDYISWTGTSRDNMISQVPLDKTYADVLVLCYSSTYKPTYIDIYELDPEWQGGEPLRLRKSSTDSSQAFYINVDTLDASATALGLTFSGKVYITPYFFYEPDNAIYQGAVTILNLFDASIEDSGSGDEDIESGNASPSPSSSPSIDLPEEDGELSVDNAMSTLWDLLKSLFSQMGQFPQLMYNFFPFLPEEFYLILGLVLIVVILMRILGR